MIKNTNASEGEKAFYEKIKTASLLVQTGEGTAYGNAMFCKGVILC